MKKESILDDLNISLNAHKGRPEMMVVVASHNQFEAMRAMRASGALDVKIVVDYSREVGDWTLFSESHSVDSARDYEVPA